jgi:predicted RNA polymerase sigma factor
VPRNPKGWLVTVASRRWTELWRNEGAPGADRRPDGAAGASTAPAVDDTLTLLLLCCHPSLTPVSQVALTLRA